MTSEELDQMNAAAIKQAELEKLSPITFEELEKTIHKWMIVVDPGVIKLLCAVVIANKLKRDPIWIFLIAPSGGGKTELLMSLMEWPDMYLLSLLTPNTFLSGMPGPKDTSLLPKISGKILCFMDWTNLMSMNKDAKNEIMGQLRDIYGGKLTKTFGNGIIRTWEGKIGIIGCSTQMVDFQQQQNAAMGERFVHYRIIMPERIQAGTRSWQNSENNEEMRKAMRQAFYAFFKGIKYPEHMDTIPDDLRDELIRVADFSTKARSGVIREFGMKKEVLFVPSQEMPTRIVQQIKTIAEAFMIVNGGKLLKTDIEIIVKIALDSIPQTNRMVMLVMAEKENQTTKEIATQLGYPTSPIHMYLENLSLLGVVRRVAGKDTEEGGAADRWTLNEGFADILRKYEGVRQREKTTAEKAVAIMGGTIEEAEVSSEASLGDLPF